MNPDTGSNGTTCRLILGDGSEWVVTSFDFGEGGARVTAHRFPDAGANADANGNGNGGEPGGPSGPNGHGAGDRTLEGYPLEHGDRLVWVRSDGSVAWAMRNPTGVGMRWGDAGADGDEDDFLAEDFRDTA